MKAITIWKDEDIGLFTIEVDGEVIYECLAADEVTEIIKELMEGEEQ